MESKVSIIESQELVDKLVAHGYENLLEILYHEKDSVNKVYTKKGRLNKSGACRALNCKPKDLEEALRNCKKILGEDWSQLS